MVMSYIFTGILLVSIMFSAITGRGSQLAAAVPTGVDAGIMLAISMAGSICLWSGVGKLMERIGLTQVLSRLLHPLLIRLFPGTKTDPLLAGDLSANICANILGMGNAATPMGMMAAQELDRENDNPLVPSAAMCMLVVINTTSFQLMPSTIIALRAAAGSLAPASVIVPIWLASAFALTVGVFAVKIMFLHRSVSEGKSR